MVLFILLLCPTWMLHFYEHSFFLSISFLPHHTLLVFENLWFVSLQTLMSSRGKIRAGIISKHQHHFPSFSKPLLAPCAHPSFTPSFLPFDFVSTHFPLHCPPVFHLRLAVLFASFQNRPPLY